jgi:hypothetical protein
MLLLAVEACKEPKNVRFGCCVIISSDSIRLSDERLISEMFDVSALALINVRALSLSSALFPWLVITSRISIEAETG